MRWNKGGVKWQRTRKWCIAISSKMDYIRVDPILCLRQCSELTWNITSKGVPPAWWRHGDMDRRVKEKPQKRPIDALHQRYQWDLGYAGFIILWVLLLEGRLRLHHYYTVVQTQIQFIYFWSSGHRAAGLSVWSVSPKFTQVGPPWQWLHVRVTSLLRRYVTID